MSDKAGCKAKLENGELCGNTCMEEYGIVTGYCPSCYSARKISDLTRINKELRDRLDSQTELESAINSMAIKNHHLWRAVFMLVIISILFLAV